jgi:pimeloyl-ACP methyl ester carboxylesterase
VSLSGLLLEKASAKKTDDRDNNYSPMTVDGLFDRTGVIQRPPYKALPREFWALVADHATPPDPAELPRFLTVCGYRAEGWKLGINWGPTDRIAAGLRARVDALSDDSGASVSVVGVSLGGVLARDLAYDRPHSIRQVITLASPYHLPTASTIEPLFRFCAMFHSQELNPRRLAEPLPVPSTAIFTRGDGIVAWQSCFSTEANCFAAAVEGPHMSIGKNPAALRLLAARLSAIPASAIA